MPLRPQHNAARGGVQAQAMACFGKWKLLPEFVAAGPLAEGDHTFYRLADVLHWLRHDNASLPPSAGPALHALIQLHPRSATREIGLLQR